MFERSSVSPILQHDNIVQYLDKSIDGDELIIVFEWATPRET